MSHRLQPYVTEAATLCQALLALPTIKHWSQTRVECIEGDASGVTGIRLRPRQGGKDVQRLAVEGVFAYGAVTLPLHYRYIIVALSLHYRDIGVHLWRRREADHRLCRGAGRLIDR